MTRFPPPWRRGVYEAIARRRDSYQFLAEPVPRQILARLLRAAHQASAGRTPPWRFVVIEEVELVARVADHAGEVQGTRAREAILNAPVNLCVALEREAFPRDAGEAASRTGLVRVCAAMQNFWLAARTEGIGVGLVDGLRRDVLQRILGIPSGFVPFVHLCAGYVAKFEERPPRDEATNASQAHVEDVVFSNAWGAPPAPGLKRALEAASKPWVASRNE